MWILTQMMEITSGLFVNYSEKFNKNPATSFQVGGGPYICSMWEET